MEKDKIIDRIKKLFALGDKNRNPNEGEVKSALRKAKQLMKHYNLSLSELELDKQKEDIIQENVQGSRYISFWERKLARMVAKLFNCDCIINSGYFSRGWIFVGFEAEAKLASQCYQYLVNVIKIMANIYATKKLEFYAGITDRLQERIDEEIKLNTPQETSKCKAIVCCKNKLIENYKKNQMKLTQERRKNPNINTISIDYFIGKIKGDELDLQNREKIK